ncbi:unnamed protein product [Phytophthora fragariaefolia]|uniref:Unnamed protein product n=1 Tax=Phytophthora fragariaefolia TaxID=1490495 RepID=A0A9W6XZK2_9STRA|nr:unnamed protein product [Phytophthora fragariaefolia]
MMTKKRKMMAAEEAAPPSAGRPAIAGAAPSSTGMAVARGAPAGPPPPTTAAPVPIAAAPTVVYRHEPKTRRLRLPKFKGLDEPKMMVKAWLRAVSNEIRKQTAILRVEWYERDVFLEMVANFEGEAFSGTIPWRTRWSGLKTRHSTAIRSTTPAAASGQDAGGRGTRRTGKTMKMEAADSQRQQQPQPQPHRQGGRLGLNDPLPTKADRLRNLRQYEETKAQRSKAPNEGGDICFYCHEVGHFVRNCPLKGQDLAGDDQGRDANNQNEGGAPDARQEWVRLRVQDPEDGRDGTRAARGGPRTRTSGAGPSSIGDGAHAAGVTGGPSTGDGARTPVSVEDSTNGDGGPAVPVPEASPTGSGPPAADALRDSVAAAGSAVEPCAKGSSVSNSVRSKRQEPQEKEEAGASDPAASGRQKIIVAEQSKAVVDDDAPKPAAKRSSRGHAQVRTKKNVEGRGHELPQATSRVKKHARRKKVTKAYEYRSGSMYEGHGTLLDKETGKEVQVGKLRAVQAPAMDLLPTAMMRIRGQWRPVKLDTGAQYYVAGRQWQALGTNLDKPAPVDYMEGFSGAPVDVFGVWRFEFESQYQQPVRVDALVVAHDTEDFLIGEDWMYDKDVKIDFLSGEMKWYDGEVRMLLPFGGVGNSEQREARAAKVRLLRKAKVQTQTVHHVEVAVPAENGEVARRSRGELDILELDGELDRDRVAAWLETLSTQTTILSNEDELEIGEMEVKDRDLMLALLHSYPSLLEPKNGCPPATTLGVVHHINTESAPPIKVRPRRHSRAEHETIDSEVEAMLHDGVIEYGTGAWGFPVVLVRKKDGSVRFCIDYRMLNDITKKDIYPLPRIDEALESMHGARRFTSLDLHAGYWQVPVAEDDRDKTAFVTRQGLFRFVRMPFGLSNAPGTFQRMMDAVPRGRTWKSCLVYLDDVIIYTSGDISRHVVELSVELERLAQTGLSLKPRKCSFAMKKLEYLGHELDADGIRPLASLPFKLVTDASVVGLGAALMQDHGSGDQPVVFASKVNSPTVARYGITDLECAAVVWATRLFRPYLYGRRFELVTDHAALTWHMKTKDLSGRLHRRALQLQEYNFTITYRAGSTNVVADGLSRAPVKTLTAGG